MHSLPLLVMGQGLSEPQTYKDARRGGPRGRKGTSITLRRYRQVAAVGKVKERRKERKKNSRTEINEKKKKNSAIKNKL